MPADPSTMLQQLGLAGRARSAAPAANAGAAAADKAAFADMLQRARDGTLASNKPVSIDDGAGVSLTDEQLARLSLAADRAEAAGLRTALVLIDDQKLILDVHSRQIVGTARAEDGVLDGIDGVIDLASVLAPAQAALPVVGPPSAIDSPAVTHLLERQREQGKAA